MPELKARFSLEELKRAVARLGEALALPPDTELLVDGTIQRFEFSIELYWKTLGQILEAEGRRTGTPRATLREAFRAGLITNQREWLGLLNTRNATSHTYDQELANRVVKAVRRRFPIMRDTLAVLEARVAAIELEQEELEPE